MSIKQKTKYTNIKRRPILIVILILLMAVVALFVAKLLATQAGEPEYDVKEVETIQVEPQAATESEAPKSSKGDGKTPAQYEGEDPNELETLTGFINYSNVSDGQLLIRATIDQLTSGTCQLTLTSNSRTVTRTVNIIMNPSSSACDGFDIPVSELSSGVWQIKIDLSSNNKAGVITGEVSL